MYTERPKAATLRELLAKLRESDGLFPPILVEVDVPEEEEHLTMDQTITTSSPPSWAARFSVEYAERPFLVIESADKSGSVVKLNLGRSRSCDVYINNSSVSKIHASLEVDRVSGEFYLVDESSRNGTFVNGERLPAGRRAPLWPGAQIGFGDALFVFIDPPTLKKLASVA